MTTTATTTEPVTRDALLDLAIRAGAAGNMPLRGLILTICGMVEADGTVTNEPEYHEPWGDVSGLAGNLGRGLAHSFKRSRSF